MRWTNLLSQNLLSIVNSVVQIVSLLTIMTILDWRMTLAALLPVPLVLVLVGRIGKMSRPLFATFQRSIGGLNSVAQERSERTAGGDCTGSPG